MVDLPEVFLSTAALSGVVSRGVRTGTIRRLEGRLYTTRVAEPPEEVVRRNLWQIVGLLFPNAVVSLLALRALSRNREPEPLLRMLDYAQAFSAAIDFTDLQAALDVLRRSNAFERDTDARLRMPVA